MRQINDPIQPRAEQILLAGLLSLSRPHRSPSIDHLEGKESQHPIRRNRKSQFARKPRHCRPIPAKTITWKGSITLLVQRLGNTSRATTPSGRRVARTARLVKREGFGVKPKYLPF
jgi:hypothetical protein